MTLSLEVAARMALDAYDSRARVNDPAAPTVSDPDVTAAFPNWERQATDRANLARNADASYNSGLEANVYVDEAAEEVVVAFRGTEFSAYFDAVASLDFGLIRNANLDNDFLTFFGYYQDRGATLEDFFSETGDLPDYLAETFRLDEEEADLVDDVIDALAFLGLDQGVAALAREGEQDLRNQAESAVLTVMEVAAANPGKSITVVGHSLGGALAAAVAGALGLTAVLFDPAPYASEGLLDHARSKAEDFLAGPFQALDTDALGWDLGTAPEDHLADLTETHRLEGSFVPGLYLTASPLDLPQGASTDRVIDLGALHADAFVLHSPELIILVLDSEARATDTRPSLEVLSRALPSLIDQLDAGALVSPLDDDTASFLRALLVVDPFYTAFAELLETAIAEVADFAPEGADVPRVAELERLLIDIALRALGESLAAGEEATPPSVAEVFGDPAGGDGDDVIVGAFGVAETVRPGLGADLVALGSGAADTISGSLAELDGDTVFDFDASDRLVFEGVLFTEAAVTIRSGLRSFEVDADGDGAADAALGLRETIDPESLTVSQEGGDTVLSFAVSSAGASQEEAETVALLYEAGLGRLADDAGLNFWIDRVEEGLTELELSEIFLESQEFEELVGDPDTLEDGAFVDRLYDNILGREGDAEGVAFWTEALEDAEFDRDDLLLAFAESAENIADLPEVQRLVETVEGYWEFL